MYCSLLRACWGKDILTACLQRAVASTITRLDNAQFIEKFRYTIITSDLLGAVSLGQHQQAAARPGGSGSGGHGDVDQADTTDSDVQVPTATGIAVAVVSAFVLAWAVHWVYVEGVAHLTRKRFFLAVVFLAGVVVVGNAYIRQQWLRYVRQSALTEVRTFVTRSHDFDSAASASIAFIKEVELVSRGYRM